MSELADSGQGSIARVDASLDLTLDVEHIAASPGRMTLDPRSPAVGFKRTPVRAVPLSLQPIDPRSPSNNVERTPLRFHEPTPAKQLTDSSQPAIAFMRVPLQLSLDSAFEDEVEGSSLVSEPLPVDEKEAPAMRPRVALGASNGRPSTPSGKSQSTPILTEGTTSVHRDTAARTVVANKKLTVFTLR